MERSNAADKTFNVKLGSFPLRTEVRQWFLLTLLTLNLNTVVSEIGNYRHKHLKGKIKLSLFSDDRVVCVFWHCLDYIKGNILSIILCYSFPRFMVEDQVKETWLPLSNIYNYLKTRNILNKIPNILKLVSIPILMTQWV